MEDWSSYINAVARGVLVKKEVLNTCSNAVIQQTIEVAKQLRVPEEEIQRWVTARLLPDSWIDTVMPCHSK